MSFLLLAHSHSLTDILSGLLGFVQMPYIYLMLMAFAAASGSYYLLKAHKKKSGYVALFLAALFTRLFMVFQDAFLHPWDERYHALVARNMLNDAFKPVLLRLPLGDYNYKLWNYCHIWVHKQPLFSWQMALSIKLFGVSEYSIRFPSAVMGAIMTVMVYDLTICLLREKQTAFFAALFFCFSRFHLEQVSGLWGLDHNDIAFHFYLLASLWAYARYTSRPHWVWPVLIGFFAGCAVLNKWLVGLVVFGGWGINLLLSLKGKTARRDWLYFFLSLIVCTLVFLPWQLYITYRFPIQAAWAYSFNRRHITEALEGHSGNMLFYFGRLPGYFGITGSVLALGGLALFCMRLFQKRLPNVLAAMPIIVTVLSIFLFFSIVVKTKTPGYVYAVAPFAAIFISMILSEIKKYKIQNKILKNNQLYIIWSTITLITVYSPAHIFLRHNPNDPKRLAAAKLNETAKNIDKTLPHGITHIFNANRDHAIDIMFYHNKLSVHAGSLNKTILDSLSKKHIPLGFFASRPGRELPAYIYQYPTTCIIPNTY